MKFYLAREGVAFGPYTEFQVRESVRLGIFENSDLALAEDGKEWSTVAQLLPAPERGEIKPDASKPTPPLAESPVRELTTAPEARPTPAWRMAWAVPVVLLICLIGGWRVFHGRNEVQRPAPAQTASVRPPAAAAPPEPVRSPPAEERALPSRETLTPLPPAASTVANPQVPDTEPAPAPVVVEDAKLVGPSHVIEGQINIAARDGRTYEPAAVEVRLYPIGLLKPYLEKRALEANARYDELGGRLKAAEAEKENLRKISDAAFNAYAALDRDAPNRRELETASADAKKAREKATNDYYLLRQEREDILSGAFYLQDLPPPLNVARTDSQGRFQLAAPDDGEYAVVAGTQRGDKQIERYYWFLPVNSLGEAGKTVLLSNNNSTAHGSAESLVQTVD